MSGMRAWWAADHHSFVWFGAPFWYAGVSDPTARQFGGRLRSSPHVSAQCRRGLDQIDSEGPDDQSSAHAAMTNIRHR